MRPCIGAAHVFMGSVLLMTLTLLAACVAPDDPLTEADVSATDTPLQTSSATRLPSPSPMATATAPASPAPTSAATDPAELDCTNLAAFVADVTVPDGARFASNEPFVKTWRLRNAGTCTWTTSYQLVFDRGDAMAGADVVALPSSVASGETIDITVALTAPATPGSYRGHWLLRSPDGTTFGIRSSGDAAFWVDIAVTGGAAARPATATNTVRPVATTAVPAVAGTVTPIAPPAPSATATVQSIITGETPSPTPTPSYTPIAPPAPTATAPAIGTAVAPPAPPASPTTTSSPAMQPTSTFTPIAPPAPTTTPLSEPTP